MYECMRGEAMGKYGERRIECTHFSMVAHVDLCFQTLLQEMAVRQAGEQRLLDEQRSMAEETLNKPERICNLVLRLIHNMFQPTKILNSMHFLAHKREKQQCIFTFGWAPSGVSLRVLGVSRSLRIPEIPDILLCWCNRFLETFIQ